MEAPSAEFLRLHPLTIVHRVFIAIAAFVYGSFGMVLSDAPQTSLTTALIFSGVFFIGTAPFAIANYIRFRYYATCDELVIFYGVFKRVKRNIPTDRIQNVAIERSLLSRVLGTASVKIETAGTSEAEGVISYVSNQEAKRIKNILQTSNAPEKRETDSSELTGFRMSLKRVTLSSIYQFSLGITAFIGAAIPPLDSVIDQIRVFAVRLVGQGPFRLLANLSPEMNAIIILMGIGTALVIIGWVAGFVLHFIRFYNFRMDLSPEKIHRQFGLFTTVDASLSYKRIQSFLIRSNLLMRLRKWYRLDLQTMGFQSGQQGFQPAMPFARWSEIIQLAPQIRSFILPDTYTSVSQRTIRRHSFRYSLIILIPTIVVAMVWTPMALWALSLLPIGWIISLLQYQHHHWALHEGHLFIRRRILSQQFWIIPVERLQAIEIRASFFQRKLGLCTFIIDTAGAGSFSRYPRIIDLHREDGHQLLDILYDQFKSTGKPYLIKNRLSY